MQVPAQFLAFAYVDWATSAMENANIPCWLARILKKDDKSPKMASLISKCYPSVKKIWLQLASGFLWTAVGIMLILFAFRWLTDDNLTMIFPLVLIGGLLGLLIHHFGFSKVAYKNIQRIDGYKHPRVCLFAFQEWKSYLLALFMISLGIYLRTYSSMPKSILVIIYMGIGTGLLLSSMLYYLKIRSQIGLSTNKTL